MKVSSRSFLQEPQNQFEQAAASTLSQSFSVATSLLLNFLILKFLLKAYLEKPNFLLSIFIKLACMPRCYPWSLYLQSLGYQNTMQAQVGTRETPYSVYYNPCLLGTQKLIVTNSLIKRFVSFCFLLLFVFKTFNTIPSSFS